MPAELPAPGGEIGAGGLDSDASGASAGRIIADLQRENYRALIESNDRLPAAVEAAIFRAVKERPGFQTQ